MDVGRLRGLELFTGLSDEQLGELLAAVGEVSIVPGSDVFREGEHADQWWVLLSGALELVRHVGREDVVLGRMDVPGRWAGGFQAWDPNGVYLATGRGAVAGSVLRVPASVLRERTQAWFPFGGHLIQGIYGTARSIEASARQRDALVTLGTLAAGLAHEINNPAAAATRSVDALKTAGASLRVSLRRLADGDLTARQFIGLDRLRAELDDRVAPADPIEVSDLEEELGTWLLDRGVSDPWAAAAALAGAGADIDWLERASAVMGPTALDAGVAWVADSVTVESLLDQLKNATRQISQLVAAVRSYTQVGRASMQLVHVSEGIESTLVMLGHRLRDESVSVERDYDPALPRIEAFPGELNQVWTNLIANALDALASTGAGHPPTLRVSTRLDGDFVVVDVADNGPGMPPEVAARAFEAFFTTKDVGKGTGLGLDIARRIVDERHGGTISVDSQPGRTVFHVRLPMHRRR